MPTSSVRPTSGHRCTLVIPTGNAADYVRATARRVRAFLSEHRDWCAIFVCDGCTDGTVQLLSEELADNPPAIYVEHYTPQHGKGHAAHLGLDIAQTPFLVYLLADLSYDPDEAIKVVAALEAGADLAIVNRASPASQFLIHPSYFPTIYRKHAMSRLFNWWLRRMLPITVADIQAGLRGMTADAWQRLSPVMKAEGFFFDVEILARAGAMGMRAVELPVKVRYVDPTTRRMLREGWRMIWDAYRLRRELKHGVKP